MNSPTSSSQGHPLHIPLSTAPNCPQQVRKQAEESRGQKGFHCPISADEVLRSDLTGDGHPACRARRRAHTAAYSRCHQPTKGTPQAVYPLSSHSGRQLADRSHPARPGPGTFRRSSAPARTASAQLPGDQSRTHSSGRPLQALRPRSAALRRLSDGKAAVRSTADHASGEGSNATLQQTLAQWAAASFRRAHQQGPQDQETGRPPGPQAAPWWQGPSIPSRRKAQQAAHTGTHRLDRKQHSRLRGASKQVLRADSRFRRRIIKIRPKARQSLTQ
ncbi:hypothetical protein NDU88_003068 [Pleurodeles waltl]|uniref:Uncharacterized protein n=1 Tax=Pleurodeles waltl TaxID=8319 RepID=A0AAV7KXF3_PLEWA|nr:hypothetical protein NDU88_003068 [Pleurodeles waltl]